jgi:Phospholipase_D-nuclease N-terminal
MQSRVRLLPVLALFAPAVSFAQYRSRNPAGGLAACGCCGTFIFIPIVFLALSIALLVWVARDAKARGMDSAVLWMLLVFFLNLIGLVIYLFARPQGNLIPCPNCGNQRLQASVKCPHCGIGS